MSTIEFEITEGPSVWTKQHVTLKSLSELQRLCLQYNIPLMHLPNAQQHFLENIPLDNATYDVYFANMSGMYYTFMEQIEETEGPST